MELTYYLRIVGRRWPFAIIGLLITTGLTFAFLQRQPFVYQSTGTMVVRPRTVNSADGVRAIDTLTRGVEISSTYATIARSNLIRERAKERLGPSVDTAGTTVSSEVVTATSILEVSVTGRDPEVVTAFATEITRETVAFVGELQPVFELQIIDEPQLPTRPIAPKRTLILGTGVVFGLGVGVVFALLAEAAARPARARRMRQEVSKRVRGRRRDSYGNRFLQSIGDLQDETPTTTHGLDAEAAELRIAADSGTRAGGPPT